MLASTIFWRGIVSAFLEEGLFLHFWRGSRFCLFRGGNRFWRREKGDIYRIQFKKLSPSRSSS
jgi:hypothetical protein